MGKCNLDDLKEARWDMVPINEDIADMELSLERWGGGLFVCLPVVSATRTLYLRSVYAPGTSELAVCGNLNRQSKPSLAEL